MCQSTGQPVVPRLWVAQGRSGTRHRSVGDLGSGHKCASLLPLWRLSSGCPLLLRVERLSGRQCSKGRSKGRRLWGAPPLIPGVLSPAYFIPLEPGAGGGGGEGGRDGGREECSVSSGVMDGRLNVRGKGPSGCSPVPQALPDWEQLRCA